MRMSGIHQFVSAITAAGMGCVAIPPAWADDPKPTSVQARSGGSRLVAWPKAIAGFCAGAIVGTPICFVRKFPSEVTQGAHGFVGSLGSNDNKKLLFVPACVAWLPVAGVVSAMEAPGFALKDAYTAEKPFSKEQFSLGDLP
jgi:hypothetical protein